MNILRNLELYCGETPANNQKLNNIIKITDMYMNELLNLKLEILNRNVLAAGTYAQ